MSESTRRSRWRSSLPSPLLQLCVLGLWAWFGGWWQYFLLGLKRGGWLMVGLAVTIGLIVLVGMLINPNIFWISPSEYPLEISPLVKLKN